MIECEQFLNTLSCKTKQKELNNLKMKQNFKKSTKGDLFAS